MNTPEPPFLRRGGPPREGRHRPPPPPDPDRQRRPAEGFPAVGPTRRVPERRSPERRPSDGPGYRPPQAWSAADGRGDRPPERPRERRLPDPGDRRDRQRREQAGVDGYAPPQRPEPIPGSRRPAPRDRRDPRDPRAADRRRPDAGRRPDQRSRSAPPRSGGGGGRPPGRERKPNDGTPRRRGLTAFRRNRGGKRRKLRIGRILLVLLLVLVVGAVGTVVYYDGKLNRVDALAAYPGRPRDTPGTNWLIVGSDARTDLTAAQKRALATGDADGSRTDTIMLVHRPPSGKTMIVSIPRDLYVPIPGQGSHKINSAFNIGGPKLLVHTVESLTGIRIDHYAEIGFGGFDSVVDAVGGVTVCLDQPLRDPKAGLRLPKGCQKLNGAQALGLVRTRAFANADLERVVNQRKFLSALMARATSPGVLLNPFRLFPFASGASRAVTVDNGDHLWHLAMLAWSLRHPITTTTPTGSDTVTDDGDALPVNDDTTAFFDHLRTGTPVPENLLSNSGGALGG